MDLFLRIVPIGLACVAILVAILTGYQNRRLSRQIATRQGVFRTPDVHLALYGVDHRPGVDDTFVISCPFAPGRPILFPFPVAVVNRGSKAAKGIKLFMRYHRRLRGVDTPVVRGPASLHVDFLDDGNFKIVGFSLGTLAPGERMQLIDFVVLNEPSNFMVDVKARTKDGVDVALQVEAWLANLVDFTLYQEDDQPVAGRAGLMVLDTSHQSLEEILRRRNSRVEKEFRKQVGGRLRQIAYFYRRRWRGEVVVNPVHAVRYDVNETKRTHASSIDEVPVEALEVVAGIKDIIGSMYFPGVNC